MYAVVRAAERGIVLRWCRPRCAMHGSARRAGQDFSVEVATNDTYFLVSGRRTPTSRKSKPSPTGRCRNSARPSESGSLVGPILFVVAPCRFFYRGTLVPTRAAQWNPLTGTLTSCFHQTVTSRIGYWAWQPPSRCSRPGRPGCRHSPQLRTDRLQQRQGGAELITGNYGAAAEAFALSPASAAFDASTTSNNRCVALAMTKQWDSARIAATRRYVMPNRRRQCCPVPVLGTQGEE